MPASRVAIVAVGTELLDGGRVDTNGPWLSARLRALGFTVAGRLIVPDDVTAIQEGLTFFRDRADVLIVTGGLGPTHDDVTREAVAGWLGRAVVEDADWRRRMEADIAARGISLPPMVFRMAQVVEGAEVLPNPVGAAPGQWIEAGDRICVLLPGPPAELQGIYQAHLEARLRRLVAQPPLRVVLLRTSGVPESRIAERVQALLDRSDVTWSILPGPARVDLEVRWTGPSDEPAWRHLLERLRQALGDDLYAEGDIPIEQVVGQRLRDRRQTLATAESCTGGLLGHRITNVPGSSEYFLRGYVAYSNEAKVDLLGVDPEAIRQYGAVSEPVVRQMAEGARRRAGTDWAVAITGIAGPTGGTPQKPVGTVHIAVAGPDGTTHRCFQFRGTRELIKEQSVQMALDLLRRRL
ncbi:MAG: competence/damage-inducible protein A [Acidobacteria bacterium]|nr:competence/damage-inducible protein A [Acidobacteriota bacterium]MDW7984520.1 competence/damage-inducible protein A [Acidobacteriota bacterium]